jgi:precorrin-3B methylase
MLLQAKNKYSKMNLKLGNFLDEPFIKNSADIVVTTYAFHSFENYVIMNTNKEMFTMGKIFGRKDTEVSRTKDLIHSLYNSISQTHKNNFEDIKEVLLKVYAKLDEQDKTNIGLVSRLVNYIWFTAYTEKLHLSSEEENIVIELSAICKHAGMNILGCYDKSQF